MWRVWLIVSAGVAVATTASAQTSVAGQSVWRHDGPTSVSGQTIWRHEGLPGLSKRSATYGIRRVTGRKDLQSQPVVVGLGVGIGCELACDSYAAATSEEAQGYYQPGYDWGAGIKDNHLAWAEFLAYLERYVLSASPVGRDAFRRGFIEAFGGNGDATYDYALRQAARPG